jgi:glycosyltransferase involved in cell wall biosynthesis
MGSFFYFSGLPECIDVFAGLAAKDKNLKLLLIGGGEQEKELRAQLEKLGISDSVVFTGFISYNDLPRYLKLSSVAINPLKISQVASVAFPHKVLQYLASGLTVVSTRLDGLVSAIDGLEGLYWVDDSGACVARAYELLAGDTVSEQSASVQQRLTELFSPKAALASLTHTLQLALHPTKSK